jgi:hypothetical protein
MKIISMTSPLQLQASEGSKPRRFRVEAYNGGLLPVDGFEHPVVVDLQGLETPNQIPLLIDHRKEVEATLGITDAIENTGAALLLTGRITGVSPLAQTVLAQDAAGQQWQASIGARVLESVDIPEGKTVIVNGQQIAGPFVLATRSVLKETSVLPLGADSSTTVNLAASAAAASKGTAMTFDEWTKTLGVDSSTLNPEQQAALQDAYNAKMQVSAAMDPNKEKPTMATASAPAPAASAVPATAAAAAHVDLMASARSEIAALHRRAAQITAAAGGFADIAATAIEQNWSVEKVELESLKRRMAQDRTRPTSFSAAQASGDQGRILMAGLSMSRKHKTTEKEFTDAELQAAHSMFRGRIGLQQVIIQAAAAGGMSIHAGERLHDGNLREALRHAFAPNLQAAFSTVSLPGIFSNLANKELLAGFEEEDNNWEEISDVKSTADFKTHTSYRLLDDMEYEELGAGGLIKNGKIGEESYTRSVDTYAKMFSLTRRDIINDDLGAFDDIRTRLGRGAARRLNRLVWTTFLSNHTTFWTTARTNYIEGATTNLGSDGVGLSAGVKAYRQRKSPLVNGAEESSRLTLGGRATKLIVPPELEAIAEALYVARNLSAVKVSDANIHANKYRVVVASELSDSAYGGGYSTTAWYLFGDTMKPVVTSFLNGQRSPTVESADADFNTLGIQFRGYHDFGCSQSEFLAGIKSKGAA